MVFDNGREVVHWATSLPSVDTQHVYPSARSGGSIRTDHPFPRLALECEWLAGAAACGAPGYPVTGGISLTPMSFLGPLSPPPSPQGRRWAPPTWDRPSEGPLPAFVDALMHQNEDVVVATSYVPRRVLWFALICLTLLWMLGAR